MNIKAKQNVPTPPMGWNSWDCYAAGVTEAQLIANAAVMGRHMKKHGWEYIVCDIQWYEPLATTENCEYRPFAELCMDDYGRLTPAQNRFPSTGDGKGFAAVSDKIHAMGLKFGLHIMRGIPRQAVHARLCRSGERRLGLMKLPTLFRSANGIAICMV